MICDQCKAENKKSTITPASYAAITAMCHIQYWDEDGKHHYHDPNIRTQSFSCSNGHDWKQNTYNRCWCGWANEPRKK